MYRSDASDMDITRMELLPSSAPVYGGGLIVTFLSEDYLLPDDVRAFLVFKGSKQRQTTEAKISLEDNAFHAAIPDHEPPETVALSAYLQLPSGICKRIATETFSYYLDPTCYLCRYLADSVHDWDSLEDWDSIQGANFSLEQEDFTTLDERLTSAFQQLILPPDWNLLGSPASEHIPRETLFHFAARLGLSKFVTLLLEKPGADECLRLRNRRNELAKDIARLHGFDGLADLITDPHAHGVIRWESKVEVGRGIILKRHSFGTVSTTSEINKDIWPPIEQEIEALSKNSPPPTTSVPYDSAPMWNEEDIVDALPPPSGQQDAYYESDYQDEIHTGNGLYPADYNQFDYRREKQPVKSDARNPTAFLSGNLKHLHDISDGIHYLRHKDMERLHEDADDDIARLSNSCPDLVRKIQNASKDFDAPGSPGKPRNRRALPVGIDERELEVQLMAPPSRYHGAESDDVIKRYSVQEEIHDEYGDGEPSPSSLQRRHSWHSSENLPDVDVTSPSRKKRFSDGEEEENKDNEEQESSVMSPTVVRRGAHKNMTMFSVVAPLPSASKDPTDKVEPVAADSRRSQSVSVNNNATQSNNEQDRRYTISEGIIPEEHRSALFACQKLVHSNPDGNDEAASADNEKKQENASTTEQLSLSKSLSDPATISQTRVQGNQQPPPVPPRPPKKIVTRKLSFLGRVRMRPKEKVKMKTFAELKASNDKLAEEDADSFSTVDADKNNRNKLRASVIHRPASMMLNRPAQYPVGSTPHAVVSSSIPVRERPATVVSDYHSNTNAALDHGQSTMTRSSYHEEEDGLASHHLINSFKDKYGSTESLDDTGKLDTALLETDPDLSLKSDEPDSWSSTIDKKTLKKLALTKKDIKRQENIFEFIQTERNHLTTLKIMQRIYSGGLAKELHTDQPTLNKLFPLIDDHVEFASQLVHQLVERQSSAKVVSGIGDILVSHWEGENGRIVKRLFGDFCSKQNEITVFYKDLMKSDKKFHTFMKKYDKNPLTRRQDVPACALLITQRLTKYPIILQTMIENSNAKDHTNDYESLERALELSREIAKDVDEQVQAHEREQLLRETSENMETKSTTTFKEDNRKFDRKDLLRRNRKLLYSCNLQWNIKDSKKSTDVSLFLLSDCIVFLQENNGKYAFPSSGQPAAVPLQKMIVREVANDEKGLYLMSMNTQQMYTLKLSSIDQCKTLTHFIRLAISNCPDEDEGITSEEESDKKSIDPRLEKAKKVVTQLELVDKRINGMLEEKMTLFKSLAESVERESAVAGIHFSMPQYSSSSDDLSSTVQMPPGSPILIKAIEQLHKLTQAFYGPAGLSRYPSSVGESDSRSTSSLPKRSDTFGGFDNDREPSSPRAKWLNSSQSDSRLNDKVNSESSNRDSGLVDADVSQHSGSQSSIAKAWVCDVITTVTIEQEPPVDTPNTVDELDGQSYLPPTLDQVTALTTLAQLLSEYQSFAVQQDTQMERLQQQLSHDRNNGGKKRSFGGGLQEAELKRNQIKQQEQMDNLRKQQQQLQTDREKFQKQFERFQRSLDNERKEVAEEKEKLHQEREENEKQRQENLRVKDNYYREMARLRDLQRNAQNQMHSSSSTSALTSTNKNNNNAFDSDAIKTPMTMSRSQTNLLTPGVDSHSGKPPSPTYSSAEYPRTFPGNKRESGGPPMAHKLPIHLAHSAANQSFGVQAPAKHQEMNPRLSKLVSNSKHPSKSTAASAEKGGLHQLIPGKLSSKLGNLSQQHTSNSLESLKTLVVPKRKHPDLIAHARLQVPIKHHDTRPSSALSFVRMSPVPGAMQRTGSNSSDSSREEGRRRTYSSGDKTGTLKRKNENGEAVEVFL